ncbi:MAG: 2-dehydropantoate 2-reductase [Peptococcaceae bacterium]|jgi:2-dehydropantoate 2-reductase|nr:2-dehydropantoate 2-reductase [Peptococcaceae bacterium]
MKILVVGLGALGTVYSCLLSKAGHEVYGFARENSCDIVNNNGVKVFGIWGEHHAYLKKTVSDLSLLKEIDWDMVIVTVKSFQNADVLPELKDLIKEQTYLCLLQNGYGNYDLASLYVPKENIIVGRVIFGAETLDRAISKVTVCADNVMLGSPENLIPINILEKFAALFDKALIPTKSTDRIMEYVWAKIIYNSALNPLGALFEVPYGDLASNEHTRAMMNEIIKEIFILLDRMGQKTMWPDKESYYEAFYGQLVPVTAAHHASMLQDIERGRKTEIEALNGAVARLAKEYGIQAPMNEFLTKIIKAKESLRFKDH